MPIDTTEKKLEERIEDALTSEQRLTNTRSPLKIYTSDYTHEVFFPPVEERRNIGTYLTEESDKINNVTGSIRQAVEHLKEYRKSLISHTVTGKIDIRNEV